MKPVAKHRTKIPRICLDPMKGGFETGYIGGMLSEEALSFNLARYVAEDLNLLDVEVLLTRGENCFMLPMVRMEAANEHRADAFVTVGTGMGGFCVKYGTKNPASKALANTIHQSLKSVILSIKDKGIIQSPSSNEPSIETLVYLPMPSVLIEVGSIKFDEDWLSSEETQKSIGYAISKGIKQWTRSLNASKKE